MSTPFEFNADHEEMRTVVRAFCAEQAPEKEVRRLMETDIGFEPAFWRRLGAELGAFGLAAPEQYGGQAQGVRAQAVVMEEFGAALMTGPVIGALALSIPALCALSNEEAKQELLPALINGDRRAAFVVPDRGGRFDAAAVKIAAKSEKGRWLLNGVMDHVVDGEAADLLLVAARTDAGVSLFAVEAGSEGLTREAISVMDLTRRQALVSFKNCQARLLAEPEETARVCARAFLVGGALLSAEQAGGARRVLDNTVEYVANRIQFGRPIGSFQAIKHRCADLLVSVEHALSVSRHATWAVDTGESDPELAVALAQSICSDVYYQVVAASIQLHGGIGFTWEHSTHLYFKRAVTDAALLGAAEQHRNYIAQKILDTPAEKRA